MLNSLLRLEVPCGGQTWVLETTSPDMLGELAGGCWCALALRKLRGYLGTVTREAKKQEDGSLLLTWRQVQAGRHYLEAIRRGMHRLPL